MTLDFTLRYYWHICWKLRKRWSITFGWFSMSQLVRRRQELTKEIQRISNIFIMVLVLVVFIWTFWHYTNRVLVRCCFWNFDFIQYVCDCELVMSLIPMTWIRSVSVRFMVARACRVLYNHCCDCITPPHNPI